jgi:hypothetical protein
MNGSNITRRAMIGGGVGLAAAASGNIVGVASAQSVRKTFVLVHGTYVGGWYWRRVSDLLEKYGHKVFSPTVSVFQYFKILGRCARNARTPVKNVQIIILSTAYRGISIPRAYRCWYAMRQRCNNPNSWAYKYYGGRIRCRYGRATGRYTAAKYAVD